VVGVGSAAAAGSGWAAQAAAGWEAAAGLVSEAALTAGVVVTPVGWVTAEEIDFVEYQD